MCDGGRVTEHLKKLLPLRRTVVALTGYQAAATPGAELMRRAVDPAAEIDCSAWGLSSGQVKAKVVDLSDLPGLCPVLRPRR
jgi:Cft2 family RNA processing exonuclease